MPIAAMIALAVVGLSAFLMRSKGPEPTSITSPGDNNVTSTPPINSLPPKQQGQQNQVPVTDPDVWPLMAQVCGLDETSTRELPARAQGGAPIVQVYSSIDTPATLRELAKFQDRGGFLLPVEIDGTTYCTIAFGPFPTEESARLYADGLRSSGIAPEAKVAYFPSFRR
jgi:hypothetical protein